MSVISLVNSATNTATGSSGTGSLLSLSVTIPNVVQNNMLVVSTSTQTSFNPITLTDTLGTTFTNTNARAVPGAGFINQWYGAAAGTGSDTITMAMGIADFYALIAVRQYTNVDTTRVGGINVGGGAGATTLIQVNVFQQFTGSLVVTDFLVDNNPDVIAQPRGSVKYGTALTSVPSGSPISTPPSIIGIDNTGSIPLGTTVTSAILDRNEVFGGVGVELKPSFISPLSGSFTFTPSAPAVNQTITFNGSGSGGISPYSFNWTFGDGFVGTGSPTTHVFNTVATFISKLVIADSSTTPQTFSILQNITVTGSSLPPSSGLLPAPQVSQDWIIGTMDVLKNNWSLSGDLAVAKMVFTTGPYQEQLQTPQISVTPLVEPYRTMNIGLNPTYYSQRKVRIDIWVKPQTDSNTAMGKAKNARWQIQQEVERILRTNAEAIPGIGFAKMEQFIERENLRTRPPLFNVNTRVNLIAFDNPVFVTSIPPAIFNPLVFDPSVFKTVPG